MTKLTAARKAALQYVSDEKVTFFMSTRGVKAHYLVAGYWQKPNQSPYRWLREEGLIRHEAPNLRGTKVRITKQGEEALAPDQKKESTP